MIDSCYALLGDLVQSRREHQRAALAQQIEHALRTANDLSLPIVWSSAEIVT